MQGASEPPIYHFSPKHRWHVKLHMMSGITLWPWIKFVMRHGWQMDWLVYPHRIAFLSAMSVINTLLALPDWILYNRQISQQPLHPEPVFILGHPRTGTTHLHNLLSLDPVFAFCNTFHAGFPSSFISMERLQGPLSALLDDRRPMDNMKLSWELPAEDEIATTVLTGGSSPYTAIMMPREEKRQLRSLYSFEPAEAGGSYTQEDCQHGECNAHAHNSLGRSPSASASRPPDGGRRVAGQFREWQHCFRYFMKKVTFWHALKAARASASGPAKPDMGTACASPAQSQPKPLLIKSPVHTARISLFLDMFPSARFIYIHRQPLEVFKSAAHMADSYYWYTFLQTPTDAGMTDFILDQYDILFEQYMADRGKIAPGRLHELSFDSLELDPLAALRQIYTQFGWLDRFDALLPKFQGYCSSLSDFKRNDFSAPLLPAMEAEVMRRWAPSFKEFGYEMPAVADEN